MTTITSLTALNRAVACIVCAEPGELASSCESDAWEWKQQYFPPWCWDCRRQKHTCATCVGATIPAHWEPADFARDPAASYRLRQHLQGNKWFYRITYNDSGSTVEMQRGSIISKLGYGEGVAANELIALCLAVCAAHSIELELVEGWDKE